LRRRLDAGLEQLAQRGSLSLTQNQNVTIDYDGADYLFNT